MTKEEFIEAIEAIRLSDEKIQQYSEVGVDLCCEFNGSSLCDQIYKLQVLLFQTHYTEEAIDVIYCNLYEVQEDSFTTDELYEYIEKYKKY